MVHIALTEGFWFVLLATILGNECKGQGQGHDRNLTNGRLFCTNRVEHDLDEFLDALLSFHSNTSKSQARSFSHKNSTQTGME